MSGLGAWVGPAVATYTTIGAMAMFWMLCDPWIREDIARWPVYKRFGWVLIVLLLWPFIMFGGEE